MSNHDTVPSGFLEAYRAHLGMLRELSRTMIRREWGSIHSASDLLNEVYHDRAYFDFGISTEDEGRTLNEGLIANKESYGARAIVYERYELATA